MAKHRHRIVGTYEEVLSSINSLRDADKVAEKKKSIGCWTAGLGALFFFGFAMIEMHHPVLLGVLGAAVLFGLIYYGIGQSGDVDDSRYESLERLHRYLAADCAPGAVYEYSLDLSPFTSSLYKVGSRDNNAGFFSYPKIVWTTFVCPVISAQVKLKDGTALNAVLERTVIQKKVTKKNFRGKVKTKHKYKYHDGYKVRLKLPEEMHSNIPQAPLEQNAPPALSGTCFKAPPKLKSGAGKLMAQSEAKNVGEEVALGGLLVLLLWTFRQLHLNGGEQTG